MNLSSLSIQITCMIFLTVSLVAVSSCGGDGLTDNTTTAPQVSHTKSAEDRAIEDREATMKIYKAEEERIEAVMKMPKLSFSHLRRFDDRVQWGVYEALLGFQKVVLIADPSHLESDAFGMKSYHGPARPAGEQRYLLEGGGIKYADTYEMEYTETQADLDAVRLKMSQLQKQK